MRTVRCAFRLALSFVALAALQGSAGAADGEMDRNNLQSEIVSQLRLAVDEIDRLPETDKRGWAQTLIPIGRAQLQLRDWDGATKVVALLKKHYASREMYELAQQLAEAVAANGDFPKATKLIDSIRRHPKEGCCGGTLAEAVSSADGDHCTSLMALARGQARAGKPADAKATIAVAQALIEKTVVGYEKSASLRDIGLAQVAIGAIDDAKKTRQALVEFTPKLAGMDDWRRIQHQIHLAQLAEKMSDRDSAKRAYQAAIKEVNVERHGAFYAHFSIAKVQAELGDLDSATATLRSIPDYDFFGWERGEAISEVATIQLQRGDRVGAENTARLIKSNIYRRNDLLSDIAEQYATIGDIGKSVSLTKEIDEDWFRAIATVRIAGCLAERGQKAEAAKMANAIDYLKGDEYWYTAIERPVPVFRIDNPKSWDVRFRVGSTALSRRHCDQRAGELTEASLRCWTAINGRGFTPDDAMLKDWDVRRAARGQASAGDAEGVLTWMKKVGETRRHDAQLGLAEGFLNREQSRAKLKQP